MLMSRSTATLTFWLTSVTGHFGMLRKAFTYAAERSRQRRALRRLDACQLKDIGLRPDDVAAETSKSFWRL
jgi:uncharacterized protein YjiS (DUF1127 family)